MNTEKIKSAAPLIIFGFLVLILIVGLRHNHNGETSKFAQHVGDPAPATDLLVLNGSGAHFTTRSWRGRPYIINFFASWCTDCRAEHEELMTLAASHIPMIGITFKDRGDKVEAYLDRLGNPFIAVAEDTDGRAGIDWGLTGVPETFVIDTQGIIRWHHIGGLTDDVVSSELMPAWESVAHGGG
jgi:cytochrome c biogenesis protein CcmG/thiol:disulfide interchange protein DsbE